MYKSEIGKGRRFGEENGVNVLEWELEFFIGICEFVLFYLCS